MWSDLDNVSTCDHCAHTNTRTDPSTHEPRVVPSKLFIHKGLTCPRPLGPASSSCLISVHSLPSSRIRVDGPKNASRLNFFVTPLNYLDLYRDKIRPWSRVTLKKEEVFGKNKRARNYPTKVDLLRVFTLIDWMSETIDIYVRVFY